MKKYNLIAVLFLACSVSLPSARGGDDLPRSAPVARYQPMMKRSPFSVATAVAPSAQSLNFVRDVFISSIAKLPDEVVVTLMSRTDPNWKEYLSTKAPNKSGYRIRTIEWSEPPK